MVILTYTHPRADQSRFFAIKGAISLLYKQSLLVP